MPARAIAFLCWAGISAAQGTLARIEGQVLSATGEPLGGAMLQLSRGVPIWRGGALTFAPAPTTLTNAEGRFEFPNQPPGHYLLRVERAGFVPSRDGIPVEVEAAHTAQITIRLVPQSAISGRVVEEHGDPVEGAQVTAIGEVFTAGQREWRNLASARTDDRGIYRLSGLKHGRYRIAVWNVRVSAGNGGITYYPNAVEMARGTFVRLREGETLSSVDIQMSKTTAPGYRIRGIAIGDDGRHVQEGQNFTLRNRDGIRITGPRAVVKNDGTFEFTNVTPGRYFVETLFAFATAGGTTTTWNDVGRTAVTVTNRDVDEVRIQVNAGYKVSGAVIGLANLDKLPRITLADVDGALAGGDASVQAAADGSFELDQVMSGKFVVSVTDLPTNTYVKSILYSDREVTHTVVEVPGETRGLLNIVLGTNAGSIRGTVNGPGNVVVLWPKTAEASLTPTDIRVTGSGEQGEFLFDHLPPGEYLALAWEGIDQGVAQYAPFVTRFAEKAVTLTLTEGLKIEAKVPLISRADADAVLEELL